MTVRGTTVDIPTADGIADAYLAHPDDGRPHPAVILHMDAIGLRPHLAAKADRLAEAGYTVLVPNAYYRHGRAPVMAYPDVIDPANDPSFFERLGPLLATLTPEVTDRDADAFLRWLADSPLVEAGPVGLLGYCRGAVHALRMAATHPERVAAVAGFHGGNLATDDPDSPHLGAHRITAELYFGHADEDPSLPPEQIARLAEALTEAGVRYEAEVYQGALHGFTQGDTTRYDAAADERHWEALLALLKRTLPA
ncbi:dienelactone hydrolase family protein [Streptomyces kaniharaensis]|uniref:Dienelactone hydrolase family protein n=1 Tax=Streptomyces kaniharaensis TaxID=212423 RepID=A0A6N7KWV6_9ACTN|nr:dienelactone hydrolase family protein [Streptomyces kaniharaensis]MQS15089.1 dienelactone hydrolase family protein [Streptomyces kaniharaensis]